jgi:hypothetical protein
MGTISIGDIVKIYGYEFRVERAWYRNGRAYFRGACTEARCNDTIRHTAYNHGEYLAPAGSAS